jgi:hypothetical protein
LVGITDVIARYRNSSTLNERSCTLKFMSSTGVVAAKAPERVIVGPFMTQGGFQYSYMACFPDSIIMVPQGIGSSLLLGMSNSVAPLFGLLGALLVHFLAKRGQKRRQEIESGLARTPAIRLRVKPNTVYQLAEVNGISFKRGKFARAGSLFTPDIILEFSNGSKKKVGIQGPDFEKACGQLQQMYPNLCKSI